METNKVLQKVVHNEFIGDTSANVAQASFSNKSGGFLRKLVFAASLAGMALFFSGCSAGYVASEPSYSYYDRPAQPHNLSIWIDGEWDWNNRSQRYYQTNGYWDNPRKGQTYQSGYWQSTPKGKTWTKGHWHYDGNKRSNHKHHDNQY
jgi:hypothetical protein